MPMIVTVAGCKGFWIPGQARNDELGAGMTGWEEEGHIKSEQLRARVHNVSRPCYYGAVEMPAIRRPRP